MGLFERTGGLPPGQRHINRQEYRLQDMRRRAAVLDMPLNLKPAHFPTNMAPSGYAVIAAQHAGGGDLGLLVAELTKAVWSGDQDIAQDDVIRACLETAGFAGDLVDKGMLASAEEYAKNLEDAVMNGAFGAPFFICDSGERFWGEDRLDDLDAHLAGKM